MSDQGLLDASGHVSAAGLAALQSAPPGRAPAELAAHLAGCGACQQKLLVASAPGPRRPPGRKPMGLAPSPGRTILLLVLTGAFVMLALWSLRWLAAP
jgi:hypothetical protein